MFRLGSGVTPRMVLSAVGELPDTSNTVAWIRATAPPAPVETPVVTELRARRDHRGWGVDRELLARVGNALTGQAYPVPGQATAGGERTETTLADVGL